MERLSVRTAVRPKAPNGKRRKKVTLVFDEDKRREFLGGFHKRKVQRKKKAQEELERQFKEERKKIKQNARERYKNLLSNRDVPELEQLLSEKEYEMDGRTVSVLELDVGNLMEGNQWIGDNAGVNETEPELPESQVPNIKIENDVRGMSLTKEARDQVETVGSPPPRVPTVDRKGLKRLAKHATLDGIRKSKVFRKKQKLESQRNKKQSMRNKMQNEKLKRKRGISLSRTDKKFKKKI